MASDLVNSATSEKLTEMDWTKNIEICELVARDQRQAKDVIKAIKKRLSNKNSNVQLYAVLLLEMLMNNIGGPVHRQVIDAGILPVLVKIVKKKSDLPVRERIFLLLDATQTSLGGASGKFPEYYSAYYELVSAGVQFPQRPRVVSSDPPVRESQSGLTVGKIASSMAERATQQEVSQAAPESSILQKASAAMEVLREVLDAVDSTNPEAAKDEFTLDLVEQCSFQKERVMHLVLTSRDERLVSQAIELNERLGKVLERHQALLSGRRTPTSNEIDVSGRSTSRPIHTNHLGWSSPKSMSNHVNHLGRPTSMSNHVDHEDTEEEEAEQLTRRMRKGKARLSPEDEDNLSERPFGLLGSSIPSERLNRPLIRSPSLDLHSRETRGPVPNTAIPPPPSKHMERERFFQEKRGDGATLAGHMRGLSLDSRSPSSGSRTGSFGSSE